MSEEAQLEWAKTKTVLDDLKFYEYLDRLTKKTLKMSNPQSLKNTEEGEPWPTQAVRLCYLAAPYSSVNQKKTKYWYKETRRKCAELLKDGHQVICPILMFHSVATTYSLPTDAKYWAAINHQLLTCCKVLLVYQLPEWELSIGVQDEMKHARLLGLPITMLPFKPEVSVPMYFDTK